MTMQNSSDVPPSEPGPDSGDRAVLARPPRKSASPGALIAMAVVMALLATALWARYRPQPKELVDWRANLAAAQVEAIKENKPLLMVFTANWCPTCQSMKHSTFADAEAVKKLDQTCVPVQIDFDTQTQLVDKYNVQAIPALLIVDPKDGHVIQRDNESVMGPSEFETWLGNLSRVSATN